MSLGFTTNTALLTCILYLPSRCLCRRGNLVNSTEFRMAVTFCFAYQLFSLEDFLLQINLWWPSSTKIIRVFAWDGKQGHSYCYHSNLRKFQWDMILGGKKMSVDSSLLPIGEELPCFRVHRNPLRKEALWHSLWFCACRLCCGLSAQNQSPW